MSGEVEQAQASICPKCHDDHAPSYGCEEASRIQLALDMPPIPQQAGHTYTGICPVCQVGH